jgi:hypothetical protein
MDNKSLAVLSVATNKYINYWTAMIISMENALSDSDTEIVAHVLTDQLELANVTAKKLRKVQVVIHEIAPYSWPEATLFRYRLFNEISDSVKEDLVMHLDADMLVKDNFLLKLPKNFRNNIALVRHPGFFRPSGLKRIIFYAQNLNYIRLDLASLVKIGGLGAWEMSQESHAFVPRQDRNNYVCGGTWFGQREAFFEMTSDLSRIENADTEKGVLPKWHDESILNYWLTHKDVTLLPPSFCFYPQYPQLKGLEEFIRAVDKNAK